MARPSKYNWEEIKKHYQSGLSQKEIVARFNVPKSSLSERVKAENWSVVELANSIVQGKIKVSEQISELSEQDEQLAIVANKIGEEKAKNTDLIHNSAKFFLSKAVNKAKDPNTTMNDIFQGSKVVTETGMNLGVIDRFNKSKPEIAIQNNNQVNNNIEDEIIITIKE